MVKLTVNSLLEVMRLGNDKGRFRNFPDDYVVIDVETTGIKFHTPGSLLYQGDLITQLGYCVVRDAKAVSQAGLTLNWTDVKCIDENCLTQRLLQTKQNVEFKNGQPTGKTYHMTIEKMKKDGSNPIDILREFAKVLRDAREQGCFYVAHNGYHFDVRMIEDHFAYWIKDDFKFGDNELFDTGMIEKGSQSNSTPWNGDTVKSWSMRTYGARLKNIKWSLDRACVPRYKLDEKYHLKMDEAHDAGFDCYVTHLLFEEFKEIAKGRRQEPPLPVRD
jgi:DNA polymerase III epsilon subunit-like protein